MTAFWFTLIIAGAYGGYWRGKQVGFERHQCMERPAALTPWVKPDFLDQDRPPREYVSVRCPDPACNLFVDLPVLRTKITHSSVGISVTVVTQTDELSIHEMSHPWS